MTRVAACYKWVLDEADIVVRDDATVDYSRARSKLNDYDRQAIQAACGAAQALSAATVGLTFGTAESAKVQKDALARGIDEALLVKGADGVRYDSRSTAKALAAAIEDLGDVSLVVCGDGSSDVYAKQTASRIGAILDWPVVTAVRKMDFDGYDMVAQRTLADCVETVKVSLPAVVAVLPEINQPPLPGIKAIMGAKKKPSCEFDLTGIDIDARTSDAGEKGYVMSRKNDVLKEGTPQEMADFLFESLKKEGVL